VVTVEVDVLECGLELVKGVELVSVLELVSVSQLGRGVLS
jgi:hypothetical protein